MLVANEPEEKPRKGAKTTHHSRRPGRKRGPEPRAPLNIPTAFVNLGHFPVGSIAWALKSYRKYFGNKRGQDIAIGVAAHIADRYPIFVKIVECWWLLPRHDREKTLALDYVVNSHNMPVREFISIIRGAIHAMIIDQVEDQQFAALSELMEASLTRAKSKKAMMPVVKEAMAHFQQHRLVPTPPKQESHVSVNVAPTQTTNMVQMPGPEDFARRLDVATRAGRELPPADLSNVIDAEVVEREQVPA